MPELTVWDEVLRLMRGSLEAEDFRRWFGATSYASDSGDQITIWVPTEAVRRHLATHFDDAIRGALERIGRGGTYVRFVVTGLAEDEDEDEE